MKHNFIQVFKPSLGQEELDALAEIFKTGWIGLGPKTAEFEQNFAEYVGTNHAIATNSATASLHLACMLLGLGPGDEVLVPTLTFVSTAHAVEYCGATPVFVDIDPISLNINLEDLVRKITPRTRAVIPVHYGGHPCPMDEIWEIAERHGFSVIEDAAHACGSLYKGKHIGGLERSSSTCFSFHAVKNLATGDGGMITTNNAEYVKKLKRLRWVGIDKSTWDRTEKVLSDLNSNIRSYSSYGWYYEVQELGYKYHMNDIAAIIGLVQLRKLDAANARRKEIVGRYLTELSKLDWLSCPVENEYSTSCWHNFVIKTPFRDRLNLWMKEMGIATGVHYLPAHLQPYYQRKYGSHLPIAERVWTQLLTLPLYPDLTNDEVDYVIETLAEFPVTDLM